MHLVSFLVGLRTYQHPGRIRVLAELGMWHGGGGERRGFAGGKKRKRGNWENGEENVI